MSTPPSKRGWRRIRELGSRRRSAGGGSSSRSCGHGTRPRLSVRRAGRRRLAGALAASLVVVACFGLARGVVDQDAYDRFFGWTDLDGFFAPVETKLAANYGEGENETVRVITLPDGTPPGAEVR